jgi:site-specific DNA recombinase
MASSRYFAYVRVSTVRQGQTGTSLTEQRSAINRYAKNFNLSIIKEFEERETAAKQGRPVFLQMVKALKQGKADGVIMHKIDRSARNLKDWADLGEMIDKGVNVLFANESLDLHSRGGRLSADIQAVVASDYIRNLREETKKGIYGRLKQGLFPFRAVVGYKDAGAGKPKTVDPTAAPFVRKAFELYSSGNWGLDSLVEEMYRLGLRSRNGRKVTRNGLATILHNPFYMGVIYIKKTDEMFEGLHEPIISKKLFDYVQDILEGKNHKKKQRHFFVFSKHIICSFCRNKLIAETQKGFVYYRCHTKRCEQKTIREDVIEEQFAEVLKMLKFTKSETEYFRQQIEEADWQVFKLAKEQKIELENRLLETKNRLSRIADAYMDNVFDGETYRLKKNDLIMEQKEMEENLPVLSHNPNGSINLMKEFLELVNSAYSSYKKAIDEEKRDLVKTITSNFEVKEKSVEFKLNLPFQIVAEREIVPNGSPYGATSRTFCELFNKLLQYFTTKAIAKDEDL